MSHIVLNGWLSRFGAEGSGFRKWKVWKAVSIKIMARKVAGLCVCVCVFWPFKLQLCFWKKNISQTWNFMFLPVTVRSLSKLGLVGWVMMRDGPWGWCGGGSLPGSSYSFPHLASPGVCAYIDSPSTAALSRKPRFDCIVEGLSAQGCFGRMQVGAWGVSALSLRLASACQFLGTGQSGYICQLSWGFHVWIATSWMQRAMDRVTPSKMPLRSREMEWIAHF